MVDILYIYTFLYIRINKMINRPEIYDIINENVHSNKELTLSICPKCWSIP